MTSGKPIFRHQLYCLIYRKYFNIIAIGSVIILCCVLLYLVQQQPARTSFDNSQSYTRAKEIPFKQKLKQILKCRDTPLPQEKLQYGEFWLLKNYIRGSKSIQMGCEESITYTTIADYSYLGNLATVIERWLAPVSIALYAPGDDYNATMYSIQYTRNCLPQSELIRDFVTFHIFFPNDHLPSFIAKNEKEVSAWPYDCMLKDAPYTNVKRSGMYKSLKNLTYPINVARNIARKTANTYFILASDIELHPSLDLVKTFLEMVVKNPALVLESENPKVFVLPVFEVQKNATLPNSKEELQQMLNNSLAIPFHKFVCSRCHLVPKQQEWQLAACNSRALTVFTVGKRYNEFKPWEPFYISDNKEPIFDERFTWETQSDKRIQNYAMCLLDYEYHVLHPAFLVHAPGIKVFKPKSYETNAKLNYIEEMKNVINEKIKLEYEVLYGTNKNCSI